MHAETLGKNCNDFFDLNNKIYVAYKYKSLFDIYSTENGKLFACPLLYWKGTSIIWFISICIN
uniref:Uncharacterized protein n=1 Tax=Romanomermis culicivorax TaxID=13658 RepID=A0A915L6G6_ROMCU